MFKHPHIVTCVYNACTEMDYVLIYIILMFSLVNFIVTDSELSELQERLLQTERMMERIVSEKKSGSGR